MIKIQKEFNKVIEKAMSDIVDLVKEHGVISDKEDKAILCNYETKR